VNRMNHKTKVSEGVPSAVRDYLNVIATDELVWQLEIDEVGERCCRVYGRHPKSTPPVETPKEDSKKKIESEPHIHDYS
jgi:hypothetical protein